VLQLMLKNVARIASNSAILAINIKSNFLRKLIADLLVSLEKTVKSNLFGLFFARDAVTLRNHADLMNCFCGNTPEFSEPGIISDVTFDQRLWLSFQRSALALEASFWRSGDSRHKTFVVGFCWAHG
jgi:hypothetical protein